MDTTAAELDHRARRASLAQTLRIRLADMGVATPDLDLGVYYDPADRVYHRRVK